jgi:hypothetical protein
VLVFPCQAPLISSAPSLRLASSLWAFRPRKRGHGWTTQLATKLIRDHLPLVHRVAGRLRASWRDSGLEIDDPVGSGTVGLVQAADRFDPTKGVSFKTYAEIVIEGAIRDGVGRGSYWFGRRAAGSVAVVHLEDLAPDGYEGWLGQAHAGTSASSSSGRMSASRTKFR